MNSRDGINFTRGRKRARAPSINSPHGLLRFAVWPRGERKFLRFKGILMPFFLITEALDVRVFQRKCVHNIAVGGRLIGRCRLNKQSRQSDFTI